MKSVHPWSLRVFNLQVRATLLSLGEDASDSEVVANADFPGAFGAQEN